MEKLKYIKIEDEEGNLSENIPLGVDMENVDINLSGESSNLADYININNTNINDLQNQDIELDEKINTNTNNLQSKIDNLDEKSNSINDNLQSQIKGLASGSPLAANSIEEMTDTTRIYVNITDGHWYYYNGISWVDGGVYQATEGYDEEFEKFNKYLDEYLGVKLDPGEITENYYVVAENGQLDDMNGFKASDFIYIKNLEQIWVKNTFHYGGDGLAFYDIDKNYISGYKERGDGNKLVLLDVPYNARIY